jgi:hypothetical protein
MRLLRCGGTRPTARAAACPAVGRSDPAGGFAARAHLHGRSHLRRGGAPRCGCGPAAPVEETHQVPPWARRADATVPARQQHAYVRSYFIYSDRMLCHSA